MSKERFKKCANCKNFIPEPAMVCMYCNAEQPGFKKEKGKQLGEKKNTGILKKIGVGAVVVFFLCIVLAIIGNLFSGNETATSTQSGQAESRATFTPTSQAQPTNTSEPSPTETPIPAPTSAPQVGEDVRVKDVRWRILGVEDLGIELKSDNQFIDNVTTPGRFIQVRFEFENLTKDMLSFGGVPLRDSQGREYTDNSDTYWIVPDNERCIFEKINPNIPKTCTTIYEVAADAAGLVFVVTDLEIFENNESEIDLRIGAPW